MCFGIHDAIGAYFIMGLPNVEDIMGFRTSLTITQKASNMP